MKNLVRKNILELTAYKSARNEYWSNNLSEKILLNANENPYTNSAKVNRYPDPQPTELITAMSEKYQVNKNEILATSGSDQGIDILIRTFCEPRIDKIAITPPTFGVYKTYAEIQDAEVIESPLKKELDYQLDMPSLLRLVSTPPKLIFITNPSAPLGHIINSKDIITLCETFKNKSVIVVDEAYIEFADIESFSKYINKYNNLVILRTLSKACSGAGLRIGALIANKDLISIVRKVLPPYPLTTESINSAIKILNNTDEIDYNISRIKQDRNLLVEKLKEFSYIKKVYPTAANFIFLKVDKSVNLYDRCLEGGIIIRNFEFSTEVDSLRTTVGATDEVKKLIKLLESI